MKRIHVMLRVKDIDRSITFYSELFGQPPTVRRADYAKWLIDDPRVNFSLSPVRAGGPAAEGVPGLEHLGIQAESPAELAELRERIGRAGGTVTDEGETICCYAASDKSWVVDEQGIAWEAFYTHGASDSYYAPGEEAACCGESAASADAGGGCGSDGCASDCCDEAAA